MKTFYWYDYETFGINPKTDRIAQFGGVRSDADLNTIKPPQMFYCQPSGDSLPSPEACLVTGITPQLCQQKGLIEREFIAAVHQQFAKPDTCIAGYNNIRFDDEFSRYALYRNFFDPYGWHWQNGNSRWDLIDVVRMCYALRKNDSLNWAYDDEGNPSFKLDRLAPANGIKHDDAHDALADVNATIALAKIIKIKQPRLFSYALSLSDKKTAAAKVRLYEPMLHTSGMYKNALSCTRLTAAIGHHPTNKNSVIVFNLDQDPQILLDLTTAEMVKRLFQKEADLPAGQARLALKEMHVNKSPMFVCDGYDKLITSAVSEQLNLDLALSQQRLVFLQRHRAEIEQKMTTLFATIAYHSEGDDVDQQLYDGFFSPTDQRYIQHIQTLDANALANYQPQFGDKRLSRLFVHFKARNYPDILTEQEADYWFETVQERLQEGKNGYLNFDDFFEKINTLAKHPNQTVLNALKQYAQELM